MLKHPFYHWVQRLSPAQILYFFYFIAIVISTFLLSLPISFKKGVHVPFIDVLFTAVSALSVTGLTTISISDTFSTAGLIILTVIFHLGAVGIMTASTFIWLIIGKKIGLFERRLLMQDQNQTTFGGIVGLIKQIVIVFFIVEIVGVIILGTYLLQFYPTAKEAYFHGYFSTISAMSNAGFTLSANSYMPYAGDFFFQFIIMILVIFGAIGFPVLIEVKQYFKKRHLKQKYRFSLFTKLTSTTFFLLILLGALFIYLLDLHHFFKDKLWYESLFWSLFQSVTTRSAGFSTLDISSLTESNQLFISLLMFIGASPSSAGGGIRTTTFALVVIFILTYTRGGKSVKIFHREVYDEDLLKAVTVTILASIIIIFSLLLLTLFEPFTITQLLFEVTSAFGTVGLSLGITDELSTLSKIVLMVLMFIGRVGLITFIFTIKKENEHEYIRYPKERIIIG